VQKFKVLSQAAIGAKAGAHIPLCLIFASLIFGENPINGSVFLDMHILSIQPLPHPPCHPDNFKSLFYNIKKLK
jgi:hypothetical protein